MQIIDTFSTPETAYDVVRITIQIMPEFPEADQSILVYWLKASDDTGTEPTHFIRSNVPIQRGPWPVGDFPPISE